MARGQWRRAVAMVLPAAALVALLLGLYAKLYGSPFHLPQPLLLGNLVEGTWACWRRPRRAGRFRLDAGL